MLEDHCVIFLFQKGSWVFLLMTLVLRANLTPKVKPGPASLTTVTRWPVRYMLKNKLISNRPCSANEGWMKYKSLVFFIGYTQLKAKTCKSIQNSLRLCIWKPCIIRIIALQFYLEKHLLYQELITDAEIIYCDCIWWLSTVLMHKLLYGLYRFWE